MSSSKQTPSRDFRRAFKKSGHASFGTGPLRDGKDVSWIPWVRAGDDQGQTSACVIFAFENWTTTMGIRNLGEKNCDQIRNTVCIEAYKWAIGDFGLTPGDGLTYHMGFEAAKLFGFFEPTRTGITTPVRNLRLVPHNDLKPLSKQPMLGGFAVTQDDMQPDANGFVADRHDEDLGGHAQLVVAAGKVDAYGGGQYVYREQSWGISHGWNGLTYETEDRFKKRCFELWTIE